MPLGNSRVSNVQGSSNFSGLSSSDIQVGYVYDVILDENNEGISTLDRRDEAAIYVGAIRFRSQGNLNSAEDKLDIAYPSLNVTSLPTRNEVVKIIRNPSGGYIYERTGFTVSPNTNAEEDTLSRNFGEKESDTPNAANYSKTSQTGIVRSSAGNSGDTDGYGDYFEANNGIHKLKLYEGDTLIESRFGQTLRFSGYNNPENDFSPTIILRNGENPATIDEENSINTTVEEDVNRDGSIILLGSGQYKLPFQPGTVDDNGSSDFETLPDSFKDYPSELLGNQLLLNSGRIILSAKNGEMIFYSKKNYGFISDGGLSIDNAFGIDVNVNDDINITTNDRDTNINSGNGKINLGNTSLEPIVKGDTLVDLLSQLIDAITQQVYLTPAGPSSTGPTNIATFNKIKNQLKTALSELNSTS
jgi:hypothetical protein